MVAVRPTIVAIATPAGGGERALVRLSGSRAKELALDVATPKLDPSALAGRGVRDLRVHDGRGEQPARIVWFSAPRSYTGEDTVEFHVAGAPPLARALVARLEALGASPAEPGEFTRRAFENGRLSLDQAEAVLALVEAQSREAARAAEALLAPGASREHERVREALADLVALGVASLDFAEHETGDVPVEALRVDVERVLADVRALASAGARRPAERGHARAALAGAPNAGKSSLFNRLARRGDAVRALVSPHAGTTRDPLVGELGDGRFTVELVDTPGLEPLTSEPGDIGEPGDTGEIGDIGAAAQELGLAARRSAAVIVWVVDATTISGGDDPRLAAERQALGATVPVLLAWNKIDRASAAPPPRELTPLGLAAILPVSAVSGVGLDALATEVVQRASAVETGLSRELVVRRAAALERAVGALEAACAGLGTGRGARPGAGPDGRAASGGAGGLAFDLVVEHLRDALDALDELSGRGTPEELLERIFARFCIGK
ncbi:MAG: 50S ribosome-binding GTPase [Planctomycetes bacterium]|nr:50S ribosome-binding GTPase [Planctomycetota bacterium]